MIRVLQKVYTNDQELSLIQEYLGSAIRDLQKQYLSDTHILTNVKLISGTNTISHTLQRKLIGWFIVRQRSAATFYDLQDSNDMQDKTLVINSSANVSVDIMVF